MNTFRTISRIATFSIVLLGFNLSSALAQELAPEATEAESKNAKATRYFEEAGKTRDPARASVLYRKAWELRPDYRTAANLAQTEAILEEYARAANHLAYWERHAPGADRSDKDLQKLFTRMKAQSTGLRLDLKVEGTEVSLDGRELNTSDSAFTLYVTPGQHTLKASAPGHEAMRQEFNTTAGTEETVVLELVPTVAITNDPQGDAPVADSSGARTAVFAIGGGLGLISAGVGIGFLVSGSAEASKAMSLNESLIADGVSCPKENRSKECEELEDAWNSADTTRNIGIAGIAAGATLMVGATLVYLLWPEPKSASATTINSGVARQSFTRAIPQFIFNPEFGQWELGLKGVF